MTRRLLLRKENDDEMPAFAVIKEIKCSRVNRSFPGSERSLSKKSVGEQTRRNALRVYERGKSAGEHASYTSCYITSSNQEDARGFSKRIRRERDG